LSVPASIEAEEVIANPTVAW